MTDDDRKEIRELTTQVTTLATEQKTTNREIKGLRGDIVDLKTNGCTVGAVHAVKIERNETGLKNLWSKFDDLNAGSAVPVPAPAGPLADGQDDGPEISAGPGGVKAKNFSSAELVRLCAGLALIYLVFEALAKRLGL